jgi:hypothetical protein
VARAYAHAVNLRIGDVPGMKSRSAEREVPGVPLGDATALCDGGAHGTDILAGLRSPRFGSPVHQSQTGPTTTLTLLPIEGATSEVYIMRSAEIAAKDVSAAAGPRAVTCLTRSRTAQEQALPKNDRESHIQAAPLQALLPGTRVYGVRVTGLTGLARFNEDTFGFAVGRFEVVLRAIGIPNPVPTKTEQHLLSALHERAAHSAIGRPN